MSFPDLPALIVCGSQIGIPDSTVLSRLWSSLVNDADLVSFRHEIEELPELWSLLASKDARLEQLPGLSSTHSLREWIRSGDSAALLSALRDSTTRNTLSALLTVLVHILEYLSYHQSNRETSHESVLRNLQGGGIQGLCIGMLSAASLACSKTTHEIARNGATALRLALCIGAYIDLDIVKSAQPMGSMAVRWPTGSESNGGEILEETLKSFPEVSVHLLSSDARKMSN